MSNERPVNGANWLRTTETIQDCAASTKDSMSLAIARWARAQEETPLATVRVRRRPDGALDVALKLRESDPKGADWMLSSDDWSKQLREITGRAVHLQVAVPEMRRHDSGYGLVFPEL